MCGSFLPPNVKYLFSVVKDFLGISAPEVNYTVCSEARVKDNLTPYPPLHKMERGNKGGEVPLKPLHLLARRRGSPA
jgi:hypothetical protein